MSLTGSVFLVFLETLTIAAFVALVVAWPTLAKRHPGMVAARAGSMLGVNLLVLLTAATVLNDQYLFFADWTDLQGGLGGSQTVTSIDRGASASGAVGRTVAGAAATAAGVLPPLPKSGISSAGVIMYTVSGPISGLTGKIFVQLPPGYSDPAQNATLYPVLETFEGYPGSTQQWIGTMNLADAIAKGVSAHTMRSTLIVSPQLQFPSGTDTECVNGAAGLPQVETWLAQDVPNWVAATFRVDTARSSWATIGLSAGGWCAAMLAMLHPAQYSAAIVMGGYFRPQFGAAYEPYPPKNPLAARYDLVALAKRAPPPIAFWIETSHSDSISYGSTAELLKTAKKPMAITAKVLQHAGHRISLWQGLLPESLTWLGKDVSGFSPIA